MKNNYYHALNAVVLLAITWLLYGSVVAGYWRFDDTQILLHAINNTASGYFFIPEVWQQLATSNLTPWVTFSFDVDLLLFGLDPYYFYIHHLISLWLVALAGYFLLSLWINKYISLTGSVLFLCGSPVSTVVQELMTRHYIEGLLYTLVSLIFFVLYIRHKKLLFIIISVLGYIVAITAKEIYVPLVLLLPFIPEATFKIRLKATIPFFIISIFYVFWRNSMLIYVIDGYSSSDLFLSYDYLVKSLISFSKIPEVIVGKFHLIALFSYLSVFLIYIQRTRSRLFFVFLCVVLVLAPLIPLTKSPGITSPNRYLFLVWFIITFSLTWYVGMISKLSIKYAYNKQLITSFIALCLFLYASFSHSRIVFNAIKTEAIETDSQLRFIWQENNNKSLIVSGRLLFSSWSIDGLKKLKIISDKNSTIPSPVYDNIHLSNERTRLFIYDKVCSCMKDISTTIPERLKQLNQDNKALSVLMDYNNGLLNWKFGPYLKGKYQIITVNPEGIFTFPSKGKQNLPLEEIHFYIKYTSEEKWVTYSPKFIINNTSKINWSRHLDN